MKNKQALIRSAVIITIIILSVIAGFIGQKLFGLSDEKNYPRKYSEYVEKYAEEYGVPEYVVYGVIRYESSFTPSNENEDGQIGLMGIRASEFNAMLKMTMETVTDDALYGPETNIRYGTLYLSYLYNKFGKWDAVYAAKKAGIEAVDIWLSDSSNYDENGIFVNIPDETARTSAEKCSAAVRKYKEMYYEN
ncbi:MAG: lytic transglycosylase domain-containing protein [Clostridia bacterium]|nr:lytic transglycosylase domain-containing protein [Clostridia bacterium]